VQTLTFIRRGRELGFTLDEIRALLALGGRETAPCGEVREIAAKHLQDITAKIRDLKKLEKLLAKTISSAARVGELRTVPCSKFCRRGKLMVLQRGAGP
jgi:MerR family mercuric resistance operon transcriptional regulator